MSEYDAIDVYKRAVRIYGKEAQTMMAIEEMAELIDKLMKYMRGRDVSKREILMEVADVWIMLGQLAMIYEPGGDVICDPPLARQCYDEKLERLKRRLDEIKC